LAYLNNGNNKSILKKWENKQDIQQWMYSYQSTAWIVIRGAWFFDFMGEILRLLVENRDLTMAKCVIGSYETKLGIYHPWVLRKLLGVAFNACTSRENFINSFIKEK